jgi:3-polyprenyl-4-hydroxybenzoate decarboxylase
MPAQPVTLENINAVALEALLKNIDNSVFIRFDYNYEKIEVSKNELQFILKYEMNDSNRYSLNKDFACNVASVSCKLGDRGLEIPCSAAELAKISESLNEAVRKRFGGVVLAAENIGLSERTAKELGLTPVHAGDRLSHPRRRTEYVKH